MEFVVKTSSKTITLSASQLIDHLSGRIFAKQKEDIPTLAIEITKMLGDRMGRITIQDLVALSMQYGYYYRVFLEKNEVEKNEEVSDKPIGSPSNEVGSETSGGSGS